jgi:hypothetical protein
MYYKILCYAYGPSQFLTHFGIKLFLYCSVLHLYIGQVRLFLRLNL